MPNLTSISVYEHERLRVGEKGFKQEHLDALLFLNESEQGVYFEPIARGVKFRQYVGVIQVDGILIEIHPKADKGETSQPWRDVLLNMLKECGKLRATTPGAAHVSTRNLNLLEVYFTLYLSELENLLRLGLIKQYRLQTGNLNALKGKLDFGKHIRQNIIHKERFFTQHQVYDQNHLIHQILAAALDIVQQLTRGTPLFDRANRVAFDFPDTKEIQISAQDFKKITLGRKSASYEYALEIARLIILNYSPDIKGGRERMLALLFDMNELWEIYILRQLKRAARGTALSVMGQERKKFWGSNYLKPDIVIRYGQEIIIIDTKWKKPNNKKPSVEDLRQMYVYCRFWNADRAVLLYPGALYTTGFQQFETDDYNKTAMDVIQAVYHACRLQFISIFNDSGKLDTHIGERLLHHLEPFEKAS